MERGFIIYAIAKDLRCGNDRFLPIADIRLRFGTDRLSDRQGGVKTIWCALVCLTAAGLGFAVGRTTNSPHQGGTATPALLASAQEASTYGARPNWINSSGEGQVFTGVRDRAYAFCFRGDLIDRACANEQDEAVRAAVTALVVAADQHNMPNKESLGLKERWVAEHPAIVSQLRSYCWALYRAHGAGDARLLAVCLGNLTDYSPLIALPVP